MLEPKSVQKFDELVENSSIEVCPYPAAILLVLRGATAPFLIVYLSEAVLWPFDGEPPPLVGVTADVKSVDVDLI